MATPRPPSHVGAILMALLVTVLWSSSWIIIREGLDEENLDPLGFAALRYGLAALLMAAWVAGRSRERASLREIDGRLGRQILVLGVVFYAVTQGAQFVAIDNQPAATTSLLLSLTPLVVAGLAAWSVGEPPVARQWVGAALVAVGAVAFFGGDVGVTAVGLWAAIVTLGANVGSSLLGRTVNRQGRASAAVVTALSMAGGAALLLAVGLLVEGVPDVSGRAWVLIAWLAAVNTAFAFTLWNRSLQRLTAIESAAVNNTMLIQIAFLAWVFLDEPPGYAGWIGIALVAVGVFIVQVVPGRLGSTRS